MKVYDKEIGFISRPKLLWDKVLSSNVDKKILDCASGDGSASSQKWLEMGLSPKNITAIDVNSNSLKTLSSFGIKTICMDLEKQSILKFCDLNSFDIIICTETIEHLKKTTTDSLLKDFLAVLKVSGNILITYPSHVNIKTTPYGHCRIPNNNEITNILERHFAETHIYSYSSTKKDENIPTYFLLFENKEF